MTSCTEFESHLLYFSTEPSERLHLSVTSYMRGQFAAIHSFVHSTTRYILNASDNDIQENGLGLQLTCKKIIMIHISNEDIADPHTCLSEWIFIVLVCFKA